jgi:hypothetical protein
MVGAGYLGLCLLADCLMKGRRRFVKAMTPERGLAAGLWFADTFLEQLAGSRGGRFREARSTLGELFPPGSEEVKALKAEMAHETLDLTVRGVGMVLGEEPTRNLPFVQKFKPMEPEAALNTMLLEHAWALGLQTMFRLVDPTGFQQWEDDAATRSEG